MSDMRRVSRISSATDARWTRPRVIYLDTSSVRKR